MENIRSASHTLKSSLENPVPATAGLDLFTRFVVTKSWDTGDDFEAHKAALASLAHEFAVHTVPSCREKICELVLPFIKDDSVVLTHSYSRVVMQALRYAAVEQRKRISVYVTESRPHGLGLRTYKQLMEYGIPCTVILDSAVAYTMPKVDLVLTGAEGVVESGGFLNAVGTYGMAIIAKACNKPFFALAESFKFLRMFPLSQYDLPTNNTNRNLLAFPDLDGPTGKEEVDVQGTPKLGGEKDEGRNQQMLMLRQQELLNPAVSTKREEGKRRRGRKLTLELLFTGNDGRSTTRRQIWSLSCSAMLACSLRVVWVMLCLLCMVGPIRVTFKRNGKSFIVLAKRCDCS